MPSRVSTQYCEAFENRFLASDPILSNLFWNGMDSPGELDEAEWNRFTFIGSTLVRHFEATYVDHKAGLLSDGLWRSRDSSMQRWMSKPGAQGILQELRSDFDQGFVQYDSAED